MAWMVLLREHGLGKEILTTSGLCGWLMRMEYHHGEYAHLVVRLPELLFPWCALSWVTEYGECESAPSVHKSCVPVWPACPQARATLILDDFADNSNFKSAGTNINMIDFAKDLPFRILFFSDGIGDKWTPIDWQPTVFVAHLLDWLDR